MSGRARDRRRGPDGIVTRPPSSPAGTLILAIVGVLGLSAVAAAVMGSGFEDVTPHGQLLGDLARVAEAQQKHHAETGVFAGWIESVGVEPSPEVRMRMVRAGGDAWEAVATHTVGLSCVQGGRVEGGAVRTDPPTCYTD